LVGVLLSPTFAGHVAEAGAVVDVVADVADVDPEDDDEDADAAVWTVVVAWDVVAKYPVSPPIPATLSMPVMIRARLAGWTRFRRTAP
jgi:hypothetical protein